MKRALPWVLGGLLVAAAGAVTAMTPDDDSLVAPISIVGAVGEPVASRTLIAAATDATFADEVAVPDTEWSAEGNWLVVTVVASAPHTEVDSSIRLATLSVDGRVFHSSERPAATLTGTALRVGIDTVGSLAFELPPDVTSGAAELQLTTSFFSAELDDRVAIPLILDDLPRAPTVDLPRAELSGR